MRRWMLEPGGEGTFVVVLQVGPASSFVWQEFLVDLLRRFPRLQNLLLPFYTRLQRRQVEVGRFEVPVATIDIPLTSIQGGLRRDG